MPDQNIADHKTRVLLVCDSTDNDGFISDVLEAGNCQVTIVEPEQAVVQYAKQDSEMVIIDLHKHLDRTASLCGEITRAHAGAQLPLLVAVEPAHARHIEGMIQAGATDFLIRDRENVFLVNQRLNITLKALSENHALKLHHARHNHALRVAKIGHWDWDVVKQNLYWSDEIFDLISIEKGRFDSNNGAFLSALYEEDVSRIKQATHNSLKFGAPYSLEHRIKRADGKVQYVSQNAELIKNSRGDIIGMRGIMQDITERYLAHEKIQHQAYHDALTGLPNRLLFHDRLEHALDLQKRSGLLVAILFIDLDRFKKINDNLGHKVGDKFLNAIANNLQQRIRQSDTLARLGGDEFAVIVEGLQAPQEVEKIANDLVEAAALPVSFEGHDLFGFASIGIAVTPDEGIDRDSIIRHADIAMYHAKELGGNQYCCYTADMKMHVSSSLSMEKELRDAIHNDELFVHYQPKVCVETGRILGMEALIRWRHPERGTISPVDFIPLAEKTGLIIAIGKWVLRKACEQTVVWHQSGHEDLIISVNVSVRQFNDPSFYDDVIAVLNDTGINPERLDLEITETCTTSNIDRTVEILEKLRAKGLSISLDDFGTGFSSLSFLNQLPLDTLKVDRSFIKNIEAAGCNGELARLIIDIASSLKLKVVAEGVETKDQLEFLKNNGCNEYQGFYLSPPVSSQDFDELLESRTRSSERKLTVAGHQ